MLRSGKLCYVDGSSKDKLNDAGLSDEFSQPLARYEADKINPVTKPFLFVPAKYNIEQNPDAVTEILAAVGVPFNPPSMVLNCCSVFSNLKAAIAPKIDGKVALTKFEAKKEGIGPNMLDVESSTQMELRPAIDDDEEEKSKTDEFSYNSKDGEFVIVDKNTRDKYRNVINKKIYYLMGAVMDTCIEAKSIIKFDNPFKENTLIDRFPPNAQKGLLMGSTGLGWVQKLNRKLHLIHRTVAVADEDTNVNEVFVPRSDQHIPHERITCLIIFEKKSSRRLFQSLLGSEVLQGTLLVNGGCTAFDKTVRVMETGKPLFVFAGTGGAAELFGSIYNQATNEHLENEEWKLSKKDSYSVGLSWFSCGMDTLTKPMKYYTPEFKLSDWRTWEREPYIRWNGGEWRHDESREPWDRYNPAQWGTDLPYVEILKAYGVLSNWPETFNKRNTLVIPTMQMTPSMLTDQLTRVMASADEGKPELGGKRAEVELLMNGWAQRYLFKKGAKRAQKLSDFINILTIILTFLIYLCVELLNRLRQEEETLTTDVLWYMTIILPVLVTLFFSLNSKWAPRKRWGVLTLASKKTEAEIFRYRARVGPYAPRRRIITLDGGVSEGKAGGSLQKSARMTFVDNLTDIFNEMLSLEGAVLVAVPSRRKQATEYAENDEDDTDIITSDTMAKIDTKIITDGCWIHKWEHGIDNRVSNLRAQQFLDWRLIPQLEKRRKSTPKWENLLNITQFTIFFCSSITAFLAAVGQTGYIAVVLAFAAAVSAFVELRQLKHRVRGMNLTISKLGKMHLWWQGLTLVQRRQPSSRERLVNETEQALIDEIATLTASAARLDSGENEEDHEQPDGSATTKKKNKNM